MKVITDAGVEAKAGDVGEIWIRTESTMTGYLDNPEATAAALDADGWYHTGIWPASTTTATCSSSTAAKT